MVEGVKLHHFRQAPLVVWRLVSVACVLVVLVVLWCLSVLVVGVVSSLFFLNTKCARHDPEKKHKPQIGLGRSLCEEHKAETCPHEEWICAYCTSPSSRLALQRRSRCTPGCISDYKSHARRTLRVRITDLIASWDHYDTNTRHASPITNKSEMLISLVCHRFDCRLGPLLSLHTDRLVSPI
jgi:hypothetical protein